MRHDWRSTIVAALALAGMAAGAQAFDQDSLVMNKCGSCYCRAAYVCVPFVEDIWTSSE